MRLIRNTRSCAPRVWGVCLAWMAIAIVALAQTISTTTVQGTVYLANGSPGSGTLQLSWPAFTTASNQAVTAGKITATIGVDGFVSVNLAPNLGSSPAGLYYTAIYHMSDGTTSTEYWVIPAAAQASIAQVRSQVMPAAQAVQAVSKAYVDQAIQSVAQGNLTSTGGQLTGPLYLTADPTQSLQAADKHYVDSSFAQAVPLSGGAVNGPLTAQQLGAAYQVDQFTGADFGAKLQACLGTISGTYGGTCDARNFSGNLSMAANLTISTANTTVMLPCATVSMASQIIVTAGTRNVSLRGCALRGASNSSGSQGGTVLLYSGAAAAIQVGDKTYAADTLGFHLDDFVINTTAATSATTQGFAAYRTQELDMESLYLLGNANQTGITLDGTGNYTGGTFYDNHISGFQTAVNGIGHQVTNSASTDWLNASTFVRLHIDCPTMNGNPISGTYGVNFQQGDGNTITGGDVENCGTAVHLGANAQNNTILGLRNENSTYQVVADAGSSYNSWITGGTMFTGRLTDNGTRNSFLDTFHRSFNSLNGDWYGSQQDATLTNHYRLGVGSGNERGLLDRFQTDYGYRWTTGLSDATGGEQFYTVLDELNGVNRLSIGQYNNGQASTNNQTVVNAAGTGAVVLNGSNNAGTGGVVFGSGGPSQATVATISNAGNAQFNGTLQVGGTAQSAGTMTVRNNADAEVDYYLWPGLTASQKGSLTYKDYNGNSQWYMVKDASNNWALNSATGGLDSFKAYQNTSSGDTYINASNASGVVRVNYESGAGTAFNIYGGNSNNLYASFSGNTSIKFPGLSAASGHNCLQIDSSGYITNTGIACGNGSGSGTVNSGSNGQIAYYNSSGTAVSGINAVPIASGGTGATTSTGALAALGGVSLSATTTQNFAGPINASVNSQLNVMAFGAKGDCATDDHNAIMLAQAAAISYATGNSLPGVVYFPKPPGGCYLTSKIEWAGVSLIGQAAGVGQVSPIANGVTIKGMPGQDILHVSDPTTTTFTWYPNWTIRDVAFVVNDAVCTINSSTCTVGSNPVFSNRTPGRTFDDGAMTASSSVFISANGWGEIGCGDIGQAIQVNGAGPSGANLVTTIASVAPCWSNGVSAVRAQQVVTLAASATTTVTNAHSYISIIGLPVTNTIGNCAIAMDDTDGLNTDWVNRSQSIGSNQSSMENVSFNVTGGNFADPACGIYTQGAHILYAQRVRNFGFYSEAWGVVQGTANTNSFYASSSGDYEDWQNGFMEGYEPWVSYNGGEGTLRGIELTVGAGPQILGDGNVAFDSQSGWNINIPEFETYGTPSTYGMRITGTGHTISNTELAAGGGMTAVLDTTNSTCNCFIGSGSTIQVDGIENKLNDVPIGTTVVDQGRGNKISGVNNGSPFGGIPTVDWYAFNPSKNRPDLINGYYPDFLADGNPTTPYKHTDMWLWPQDLQTGPPPYSQWVIPDVTSITGYDMIFNAGYNLANFQQFPGNPGVMTVGTSIPAAPITVYAMIKCASATSSFEFHITTTGGYVGGTNTGVCGTSFAVMKVQGNLAGQTGNLGLTSLPGNPNAWVQWLYLQPAQSLNGFTVGGNATGAALVTGPASSTQYDLLCYADTYGTTEDCGTTPGSARITSSTSNVAMTLKSTYNNSSGSALFWLYAGSSSAGAASVYGLVNTAYWDAGLNGSQNYQLLDLTNSHAVLNFPNNVMPANSLGGDANGPTATVQAASDRSAHIAVTSLLPLIGTTGSIGGSALALGACTSGTVSITGATTGMAVVASPTTYPGDGMVWRPYVSAAGTVTVKVCAQVAGTPTASTYNVRVIQ